MMFLPKYPRGRWIALRCGLAGTVRAPGDRPGREGAPGRTVAVARRSDGWSEDEMAAVARLISAAPRLHAVVAALVDSPEAAAVMGRIQVPGEGELSAYAVAVRALTQTATGRAPEDEGSR